MHQGKLVIFSAPSGAGKTTLVKYLLEQNLNLEFSISATSRSIRPDETDGKDYYFIPAGTFKNKINNDEFLEWEEVYADCFYGTLKSELERIWIKGKHVIFDVDVVGGLNIKRKYSDRALSVFIKAPTVDDLEFRLRKRSTESEELVQVRLNKAIHELKFEDKFDKVVINDDLEVAKKEAFQLVKDFLAGKKV